MCVNVNMFSFQYSLITWVLFSSLTTKATDLEGERKTKMKEWKDKVAPLKEWLKKEEAKCVQYQTTPDNDEDLTVVINQLQVKIAFILHSTLLHCLEATRNHYYILQSLVETIEQKEKQLNIILRLSEDALQSSSLSDEDRNTIHEDTDVLQKGLATVTEKTQTNFKR